MSEDRMVQRELELDAVISKVLCLRPSELVLLSPKGSLAGGLNELMRLVLLRALDLVDASDDYKVRLYTDAASEALGYPGASVVNLMQFFAYSMTRESRRPRGRNQLSLSYAEFADAPPRATFEPIAVDDLIRTSVKRFAVDIDAIKDAPGPEKNAPISICALVRDFLGLQPESLIRPYYNTARDAQLAFGRDPEGQAAAGMSALMMSVLHHYPTIANTRSNHLTFWIAGDADGPSRGGVFSLGTVMAAGLFASGDRTISFVS